MADLTEPLIAEEQPEDESSGSLAAALMSAGFGANTETVESPQSDEAQPQPEDEETVDSDGEGGLTEAEDETAAEVETTADDSSPEEAAVEQASVEPASFEETDAPGDIVETPVVEEESPVTEEEAVADEAAEAEVDAPEVEVAEEAVEVEAPEDEAEEISDGEAVADETVEAEVDAPEVEVAEEAVEVEAPEDEDGDEDDEVAAEETSEDEVDSPETDVAEEAVEVEASEDEAEEISDGEAVADEAAEAEPEPEPISPYDLPGGWYVIHSYSGYENKVKTNLATRTSSMHMEDRIFEVVIPMETVVEIKGGRKVEVERKMFPGYILVRMYLDDDSWYAVRNTPGVTAFVGGGIKPTPLSRREVERFLGVKKEEEKKAPRFKPAWEIGEMVRVVTGPFADFNGMIEDFNVDQQKVKVLVEIFGRDTPMELNFEDIQKQ